MSSKVVPYKNSDKSKQQQVQEMFDNISHRYDFLNTLLSFGISKYWRNRLAKSVQPVEGKIILDVATGTADVAIGLAKCHPIKVIGVDISQEMLNIGRQKILSKNLQHKIELAKASAEQLPYA